MAMKWSELWLFVCMVIHFLFFVSLSINEIMDELPEKRRIERAANKPGNNKFKFDQILYDVTIRDDIEEGTVILVTSATFKKRNAKKHKTLNYRLKDKDLRISGVFPFSVAKATGEIILIGPISNETDLYEFKVEAYISGDKKMSQKATVYVTIDRSLIQFSFTSDLFQGHMEENIYGDVYVTLELIGVNLESDYPPRYDITEIIPDVYPSRFGINPSGIIFVRHPLDREDVELYYITITVGQDGVVDRTMVMIHVTDQNDNPPNFPYDQLLMSVYENVNLTLSGNTFVKAYDDDTGPNADIRYEILSGSLGMIYIDHTSGQLYNSIDLDYEKIRRIKLIVAAYSGELYTTCKVFLFIKDMNDNPPIVDDVEVFYNRQPNNVGVLEVARIPARDPDETGILRFGILRDNTGGGHSSGSSAQENVQVDANTGIIRINPMIQNLPDIDIDIGIYVFDGVHVTSARCRIMMTAITDQMVEHSVSAHILNVTGEQFLTNGGLQSLRNATRDILGAASVIIFNIEEFHDDSNPFINVSFFAKKPTGILFSSVEILNAMFFQNDMIETLCGFHILASEQDTCVSEMCNKRQRCVRRKTLTSKHSFYEAHQDDVTLRFFGVQPFIEHWCECLDMGKDGNCSNYNPCDLKPCFNKGMCYDEEDGYGCICPKEYTGVNCDLAIIDQTCFPGACGTDEECENLPTGSFHCVCKRRDGCPNDNTWYFPKGAYLAFPGLRRKTTMKISLQFSTTRNSGLLMYLGRYSFMYDFLALEIIRTEISLTFNVGRFIMRVKVGVPGGVSDGKWHMVELKYHEKVVQVTLDECNEDLYEFSNYPCAAFATQSLDVTTWFLDVNTPFILGSLPVQDGDSRILNHDFEGCIKDVHINNRLYGTSDTIRTKDTEQGCPWYKQRPELSLELNDEAPL